jgi:glycosyltransferase involved in cell wall biosynthesis
MSKLKIVIVSRALPYLGGREVIVNRLIYNFLNKNVDILLITPDNYPNKNIKVVKSTLSYKSILNKVKNFNPDIINCHTFYFHDLSFKLSKDIDKPLISTLHGIFISLYGKNYKKLIKKIVKESEKVIVVSNNFKKALEKTFKIKNKILSIRNGIEKQTSNGFKLRSNKITILIPARFNKIKGIEYAIKAMKLIDNRLFSLIISSPKGRKNIEETIYRNKIKLKS